MIRWQQLHKWLGLLIGIQLLLWLSTGLLLNIIPPAWFSADLHLQTQPTSEHVTSLNQDIRVSINDVVRLSSKPLSEIELITIVDRPAYQLTQLDGQKIFIWADTMLTTHKHQQALSTVSLSESQIQQIAHASYRGDAPLEPAKILNNPTTMPKGTLVITARDEVGTRIFVNRHSGNVIAHQNDRSDYQQWLLMLHFMDYNSDNGVSFNHVWTQIMAVLSLLFAISGIRLLLHQLRKGHFWPLRKNSATVNLYHAGQFIAQLNGRSGVMLDNINRYAGQGKGLITQCGGGGQCGLCALQYLTNPPAPSKHDIAKLSARKLTQGYRLSCQHIVSNADLGLSSHQLSQWYENDSKMNKQT